MNEWLHKLINNTEMNQMNQLIHEGMSDHANE